MKTTFKKLIAALLLTLLAVLPIINITASAEADTGSYTAGMDLENAITFTFSENAIEASGSDGFTIDGTALKIEESGTYVLTGSCADGSVTVKKGTENVYLVLSGLDLTSADTAPICCNKGTEVTIVALEGTVNTLTDSELNNDETHTDNANAENAVIKCKDGSRVVIAGGGTLNIVSNGKNGIKGGGALEEDGAAAVDASLTIAELTLNITANVNDALKADQLLNIVSGTLNISAADDAIKSDLVLNIGAEGTYGPVINIEKSYEGIEGAEINIHSGNITVNAEDDGINAANSDLSNYSFSLNITGGTLYVNAENGDGLDSNGTLNISGGNIIVFASSRGDNSALDGQSGINITGGTVLAVGASGMAEGPSSKGQTYVVFGAGGMMTGMNSQSSTGMTPPDGTGMTPPDGSSMTPPDGSTGMTPPDGSTGMTPPDGSTGMTPPDGSTGMTPPDGSDGETESTVNMGGRPGMGGNMGGFGGAGSGISISAGDTIAVTDENGSVIAQATAPRAASYVLFSSADLSEGSTYKLTVNGTEAASATATSEASAGGKGGMGGFPGQNGKHEHGGRTDSKNGSETDSGDAKSKGLSTPVLIAIIAGGVLVLGAAAAVTIAVIKGRKNSGEQNAAAQEAER